MSTKEREPRDVLADRIQQWADTQDWHVYDYADRLLNDLDAAGFKVVGKGTEGDEQTAEDWHDPENEMGVECWIREALAEYREYDGLEGGERLYTPGNVVNAVAPELVLVGKAGELGVADPRVHPHAPVYAWVAAD